MTITKIATASLVGMVLANHCQAQMAVIDVQSLSALRQQLTAWQTQINLLQNQVKQMDTVIQNQSGNRGYVNTLRAPLTTLNYLSPSWQSSTGLSIPSVSDQNTLDLISKNNVLTRAIASNLSDTALQKIQQHQFLNAQAQSFNQQAYSQSSARMARINSLIDQIGTTHDPQSSAELQNRLQGEELLLLNELIKLVSIQNNTNADGAALTQSSRESNLVNHGSIATRFHPKPGG